MRPTIVNLRQFYSSRLGRKVKQRLRQLAVEQWPQLGDDCVVGIGYAAPMLRVMERSSTNPSVIIALMPDVQGAIYWPVNGANRSIMADVMTPPFAPASLQRVVMLHAFEHVAEPEDLLRVYWHMLAPGGCLLLVVPNRHGLWARLGGTPFRQGTPHTLATVRALLNQTDFTLCDAVTALFTPPSSHPFWLRAWPIIEWLGRMCVPGLGGVILIRAEKQIYANIRPVAVSAKRKAHWAAQPALNKNAR